MGLRPGRCYRSLSQRPYTRTAVKVHDKNYIGTSPHIKIRQYNMGNTLKKYSHILDLKAGASIQIRDNAIEATRINAVRRLNERVGKENYFLKLRVFPHNILRENKQAQGAGADRVSSGMSHAFGRPIGRSARVKKGQTILSVLVNSEDIEKTRKVLLGLASKLPCKVKVKVHTDTKSIGTIPKKVREKVLEKKEEEKQETEKKKEKEETGKSKPSEKEKKESKD